VWERLPVATTGTDTADARGRPEPARAGYRRSTGSPRGEARRQDLLDRVTDDLAVNGLVDFSLRRAARAAGTTHKVLLYYFDGPDDLLAQAVPRLRERRIENAMAAARGADRQSLAERVRVIWPALMAEASGLLRVLDQAMGLAMYDPGRYAALARDASQQYLPALRSLCPDGWSEVRKTEVAQLVLAAMRGFLVDWRSTGDPAGSDAGLSALVRALEREEAAGG
jgi:DNA-binding transcriptional regulator YbjK